VANLPGIPRRAEAYFEFVELARFDFAKLCVQAWNVEGEELRRDRTCIAAGDFEGPVLGGVRRTYPAEVGISGFYVYALEESASAYEPLLGVVRIVGLDAELFDEAVLSEACGVYVNA
jgi:hypothetical protein